MERRRERSNFVRAIGNLDGKDLSVFRGVIVVDILHCLVFVFMCEFCFFPENTVSASSPLDSKSAPVQCVRPVPPDTDILCYPAHSSTITCKRASLPSHPISAPASASSPTISSSQVTLCCFPGLR